MSRLPKLVSCLFTLGLFSTQLLACGGEEDPSDGSGSTGGSSASGGGPSGSALTDKLAACPEISTTSDKTASECLEGTYEGKDLAGNLCTLTIGEAGVFDFNSDTLEVPLSPKPDAIYVYGHTVARGFHQIHWSVSDPLSIETHYEMDFSAIFDDTDVAGIDEEIEFEVTEYAEDSTTSVVCTLPL